MFSDAHTHLTGSALGGKVLNLEEIREVLKKAKAAGVVLLVASSHDLASAERLVQITSVEEIVYGSVGIHPWIAAPLDDSAYKALTALAKKPKIVAIGEIGLDRGRSRSSLEVQLQTLIQMLLLSKETGLPPVIHCRGCQKEIMEVLGREKPPRGVVHGFSGNSDELREWLGLGYDVTIGQAVLRPGEQDLMTVVQQIPEERLLLETDGPTRSEAGILEGQERVVKIAEVVASWRGMTPQKLGEITTNNLRRLLGIRN